MVELAS